MALGFGFYGVDWAVLAVDKFLSLELIALVLLRPFGPRLTPFGVNTPFVFISSTKGATYIWWLFFWLVDSAGLVTLVVLTDSFGSTFIYLIYSFNYFSVFN